MQPSSHQIKASTKSQQTMADRKNTVQHKKILVDESESKKLSMKAMFEMAQEQSKGPLIQDMQQGVNDDEW